MNNFNFIAPFYDSIAKIVFGQSIKRATHHFLTDIGRNDRVLVIGGGTGRLLSELPETGSITYLEKSSKMLSLAKARKASQTINFVNADFFDFNSSQTFDAVICPFFLDCFSQVHLVEVLSNIHEILRKDGQLIVTDFQQGKSPVLMKLMHLFFRVVSSLNAKRLEDIHHFVLKSGFKVEKEEFFHKKMIFSRVYRNL